MTETSAFGSWWPAAVNREPDREILLIEAGEVKLSRADLDLLVRRFAAWYHDRGLRQGEAVLIDAGGGELAIPAVFGAMALGLVPLCLPPDATEAQRRRSAEALGARLELRGAADDPSAVSMNDEGLLDALATLPPLREYPKVPAESDAVILFSSGTTGLARGCRISHRALYEAARQFPKLDGFPPWPRVLVATTVHTITGLRFALPVPALQDASTVWLPAATPAPLMMVAASHHGCSVVSAGPGFVPAVLQDVDRVAAAISPGAPALVWAGGGAVTLEQRARFTQRLGVEVHHAYGLTETCGTLGWWTLDADGRQRWRARDGVTLRVEREAPEDPFGTVLVHTAAAFTAYLDGSGPRIIDGQPWVDTGDLGHIGADGELELRGRRARMFTATDGEKVLIDEVEAAIRRVSGHLSYVGVLPGTRPTLAALVEQSTPWTKAQDRALRELLPARALPKLVRAVPQLPLNVNGKLDPARCQSALEQE